MHWSNRLLTTAFLLVLAAPFAWPEFAQEGRPVATATPSTSLLVDELPGEQAEQLAAWLQALVDDGRFAGMSAQLVRGGAVVYRSVHGELELGSGRPIAADSLFRIYSMSKAITSVAVMQLVERGKLGLDDALLEYLPEWKDVRVLGRDAEGGFTREELLRPITVRDLLRHTAGIPYASFSNGEMRRLYDEEERANGAFTSLDELSQRLAKMPLAHQPGASFTYGRSTDVLGRLVEVVAEQPFDAYLGEHIFAPLGMGDTSFRVAEEQRERLAAVHSVGARGKVTGVAPGFDERFFEEAPVPLGGEGLVSTLEDFGRFQSMLLGGGALGDVRLLAPETVARMLTTDAGDTTANTRAFKFGLGFQLQSDPTSPGSDELRTYTWAGYARTYFYNDVKSGLGILLYTQTVPPGAEPGGAFRAEVARVVVGP